MLGSSVGQPVGGLVNTGCIEGSNVGVSDGDSLGASVRSVGAMLSPCRSGVPLGCSVGVTVGPRDGSMVGPSVGVPVGTIVGRPVGRTVGTNDGISVL